MSGQADITTDDASVIAVMAARKIIDTDNWAIELASPDPSLKGAPHDIVMEDGQRCTLVIIVRVVPHPNEQLAN